MFELSSLCKCSKLNDHPLKSGALGTVIQLQIIRNDEFLYINDVSLCCARYLCARPGVPAELGG